MQCDTYQQLYVASDPTLRPPKDVLDALETAIVRAYAECLLFLGFTIQRQRSWTKAVNAPFRLGDVERYVKGLGEKEDQLARAADSCERHCNRLDRSWVKELLGLAEESRQAMRDQAYV